MWKYLREKFASTALPTKPVVSPKPCGKSVLIVDDDNSICRIVHRMLSDEKYQVQTSQSVADALVAIEQKSFDAYVTPSAVALRAEKLNISDFLEKPFSREMICNAMKKAIGSTKGALA